MPYFFLSMIFKSRSKVRDMVDMRLAKEVAVACFALNSLIHSTAGKSWRGLIALLHKPYISNIYIRV